MTWGELVQHVEDSGITADMGIDLIEVSGATEQADLAVVLFQDHTFSVIEKAQPDEED